MTHAIRPAVITTRFQHRLPFASFQRASWVDDVYVFDIEKFLPWSFLLDFCSLISLITSDPAAVLQQWLIIQGTDALGLATRNDSM